jgi:hypothetical protein
MGNRVKTFGMWWPGTELNRRRQPFQNRGFEYLQRFTSRRGLSYYALNSMITKGGLNAVVVVEIAVTTSPRERQYLVKSVNGFVL